MAGKEKMNPPHLLIAGTPDQTQNYVDAFTALGACCHNLPCRTAAGYDALILPGGGDIDPTLFSAENQGSRSIDPILDRLQLRLLFSFLEKRLPVLGICKGMQMINVCFGGGIIQDLPTRQQHEYIGRDQIHSSRTQKGSFLHSLYGENFPVNSAHHQGISEPGRDLRIIQSAPDGVAEAISHTSLPVLGVQWHPERMCFSHRRPDTPDGSLLLTHFLSLCRD